MAITWEFVIEPIDVPNRIVSVTATRADDAAENPDPVYVVSLQNADISTTEKKLEALDVLWAKYLNKKAKQELLDSIAGEVEELEGLAKENFEGRES